MKEQIRVGTATITRKSDTTAVIRIRPRVFSKKSGRKGTRRSWSKINTPTNIEVYIGTDPLSALVLYRNRLHIQYILSSKHLKPAS